MVCYIYLQDASGLFPNFLSVFCKTFFLTSREVEMLLLVLLISLACLSISLMVPGDPHFPV